MFFGFSIVSLGSREVYHLHILKYNIYYLNHFESLYSLIATVSVKLQTSEFVIWLKKRKLLVVYLDHYFRNGSLFNWMTVNCSWRFLRPFTFKSQSVTKTCSNNFEFWHNKHSSFFIRMRPKACFKLNLVESYDLKTMNPVWSNNVLINLFLTFTYEILLM